MAPPRLLTRIHVRKRVSSPSSFTLLVLVALLVNLVALSHSSFKVPKRSFTNHVHSNLNDSFKNHGLADPSAEAVALPAPLENISDAAHAERWVDQAILTVDGAAQGRPISPSFFGIFLEEINHGGAGGLYAELVQNRGFEAGGQETPSTVQPWLPIGSEPHVLLSTERCSPFPRNPIALRIDIRCAPPPSPGGGNPTPEAASTGEQHLELPSQRDEGQHETGALGAVGWEPALGRGAAVRQLSASRGLTHGEGQLGRVVESPPLPGDSTTRPPLPGDSTTRPPLPGDSTTRPGSPSQLAAAGVGVWAAVRQWLGGWLGVRLADGDSRGELAGQGVGGGGKGREGHGEGREEGEEGEEGRACEDGVGVLNPGYWGMSIQRGHPYNIILHARASAPLSLRLSFLCSPALLPSRPLSSVPTVGSAHISLNQSMAATWHRYEATIFATGTCHNASLAITTGSMTRGTLWLDQISAMPTETFKSHGMRVDIATMLQGLSPGFMRFPGGCYVEGVRLANAFRWRATIGPWELRPGHFNDRWGYWSDDGLGFFEYLQFAEDLGATPIWVFNSGHPIRTSLLLTSPSSMLSHAPMRCHAGNSHTDSVFTGALAPFIQEVLDGIEFARGPSDSRWGAERAAMGHPEPFDLRHVGIGNENCYQENYRGNFLHFRAAIKAAYPDMAVVYTCDISKGPPDHPPTDLYDFHSYGTAEGIFSLGHYFDDISRDGPKVTWRAGMVRFSAILCLEWLEFLHSPPMPFPITPSSLSFFPSPIAALPSPFTPNPPPLTLPTPHLFVQQAFLSEFAVQGGGGDGNVRAAVAEAGFLIGLERNSDVVAMVSYAPLLVNVHDRSYWLHRMFQRSNSPSDPLSLILNVAPVGHLTSLRSMPIVSTARLATGFTACCPRRISPQPPNSPFPVFPQLDA
ncbi:unnamed protein product [Closterium sp. NIES-53]